MRGSFVVAPTHQLRWDGALVGATSSKSLGGRAWRVCSCCRGISVELRVLDGIEREQHGLDKLTTRVWPAFSTVQFHFFPDARISTGSMKPFGHVGLRSWEGDSLCQWLYN